MRNSRPLFQRAAPIIGAIKMGEEPKALFDHNISSDGVILSQVEYQLYDSHIKEVDIIHVLIWQR